jgi:hypothetical protein
MLAILALIAEMKIIAEKGKQTSQFYAAVIQISKIVNIVIRFLKILNH